MTEGRFMLLLAIVFLAPAGAQHLPIANFVIGMIFLLGSVFEK